MSVVDSHTLILSLISEATRQPELDILRDMQKLGASIVLCDVDRPFIIPWTPEYYVPASNGINDWLRSILYLPLMQRLGYYRALANDQTPDNPKNLQQVIEF